MSTFKATFFSNMLQADVPLVLVFFILTSTRILHILKWKICRIIIGAHKHVYYLIARHGGGSRLSVMRPSGWYEFKSLPVNLCHKSSFSAHPSSVSFYLQIITIRKANAPMNIELMYPTYEIH